MLAKGDTHRTQGKSVKLIRAEIENPAAPVKEAAEKPISFLLSIRCVLTQKISQGKLSQRKQRLGQSGAVFCQASQLF